MAHDINKQPAVDAVYEVIAAALINKLSAQGYLVAHQQNDDEVFGSRYTIWSDNNEALRFTWDGKEQVFILAVADTLPISSATIWNDVAWVNYQPQSPHNADVMAITQQILDSLSN